MILKKKQKSVMGGMLMLLKVIRLSLFFQKKKTKTKNKKQKQKSLQNKSLNTLYFYGSGY
jgi:hypothetical protein